MFTTHSVKITIPSEKTPINLRPFSDVHRDSKKCDENRWLGCINRWRENNSSYCLYLGVGDYNDFASFSERHALKVSKLHDDTIRTLDEFAMQRIVSFSNEISFMRGKLIGLLEGNHHWKFMSGDFEGKTSTEVLCERLGCKYLGNPSYIRISICVGSRSHGQAVDIFAAHGKTSSAKLAGTTFNNVDDLKKIFPMADIYITGHDHRKGAISTSCFEAVKRLGVLTPKQKRQWLCKSGGFLRGYVVNETSYISEKLLKPTDLGAIELHIDLKRVRERVKGAQADNTFTDIHVSY